MMALTATISNAAKIVTALGVIGGGTAAIEIRYAHQDQVDQMQAADRVRAIYDLVEIAQRDGPEPWICRAIDEEHLALCTELPGHYLCTDPDAFPALKSRAGC